MTTRCTRREFVGAAGALLALPAVARAGAPAPRVGPLDLLVTVEATGLRWEPRARGLRLPRGGRLIARPRPAAGGCPLVRLALGPRGWIGYQAQVGRAPRLELVRTAGVLGPGDGREPLADEDRLAAAIAALPAPYHRVAADPALLLGADGRAVLLFVADLGRRRHLLAAELNHGEWPADP